MTAFSKRVFFVFLGIVATDGDYTVDHSVTGPFTVDALQSDFTRIVAGRA